MCKAVRRYILKLTDTELEFVAAPDHRDALARAREADKDFRRAMIRLEALTKAADD